MNQLTRFRNIRITGLTSMAVILCTASVKAQVPDTVSLYECHHSAMETHPVNGQKELYLQSKELNLRNQSTNWYPSLDLNGKYTWQNEVVEFPFTEMMPGVEMPSMPHYNYKLTLDIQQTLYDGGITRKGKELEARVYDINRQQVEISLNQLKERVNSVYFFILVAQEQERTIKLKHEELQERLLVMESLLRNETVQAADLSILKAECLKVEQQLAELSISRESALNVLNDLTSLNIKENTVLALPTSEVDPGTGSTLPEQILYEMQISKLDASIRLAERQRYPKAFVFGQLGYGNPALNFFKDEFREFYVVGAGLQWKIWDWNATRRQKQVLAVQQDIIRTRQEAFNRNLNIRLKELMSNIIKYEEAINRDLKIVQLREEITQAAVSRLENGVITSTDYITELNAEMQARIQLDMHRIQLEQARIDYLTAKGLI